jgi:excinuclease ABC subunit A
MSLSSRGKSHLRIRGAREHTLKGISIDIPHNTLVGITGVSGSGKSSLAFDTIYGEGQRRYIETFSPYTRQFFDKVKKPNAESIEQVRPAIAIQQRTRVVGARSTVGTLTGINDYLKVLWNTLAHASCPRCDIAFDRWTPEVLAARLMTLAPTHPWLVAAPYTRTHSSSGEEIKRLLERGFGRYFNESSGTVRDLEEYKDNDSSTLLVVVDRFKGKPSDPQRVREAIESALSVAPHEVVTISLHAPRSTRPFVVLTNGATGESLSSFRQNKGEYRLRRFPREPGCAVGPLSIPPPSQGLFSFNHPYGACPECKGFGHILTLDTTRVIPDPRLSVAEGAIQCWTTATTKAEHRSLLKFCAKYHIPTTIPWASLSEAHLSLLLHAKEKEYWGIYPWFEWLEKKTYKMHVRVYLSRYRTQTLCPSCKGTRLKEGALAYKIKGKTLPEVWKTPLGALLLWCKEVRSENPYLTRAISEVLEAVITRLEYLVALGLPYLTLERAAKTLSGGETQRVNLTTALGSELTSTQFVLDEPSVGLHPRDSARLLSAMKTLSEKGNSVLTVEHDLDILDSVDHLIELGPYSGEQGGSVVFNGPRSQWSGIDEQLGMPSYQILSDSSTSISIKNASLRNLKNVNITIPLKRIVVFAGVSGSGKTTLVKEVLFGCLTRLNNSDASVYVSDPEAFSQVLYVDQSPLAKSARANIATYTGMWEVIRNLLANTSEAQERGLTKSAFSFNVDGGRCPHCKGAGAIREDMQFLSDVLIPCEVCSGTRFTPKVLDVTLRRKSVDQLLALSVDACGTLFHDVSHIASTCESLSALGLGHLSLGHSLSELSGGEAQRLKLVPFLQDAHHQKSLLLFDEPTTGLHVHDVYRFIELLRLLREKGHSIICVEHNLPLIAHADSVIELGPEGGEGGGQVLFEGHPFDLCNASTPTGIFLRGHFERTDATAIDTSKGTLPEKPTFSHEPTTIAIRGATEHNLKNVNLDVPLGKFVAITGVSGSGKSTIARDIIFSEGQRRYLDCLSPYARQFVKDLTRPEIHSIEHIPPTICVEQHTFQPSSLSTVGTMSETYHFLRLLYSKVGTQYCTTHPLQAIGTGSPEVIAETIRNSPSQSMRILAPVIKSKKGGHREIFQKALDLDLNEVRVDGMLGRPSQFIDEIKKSVPHTIEYCLGKFSPDRMSQESIESCIQHALILGSGEIILLDDNGERVLSTKRSCPLCGQGYFKPDPEDFSFQSSRGRCKACNGSGRHRSGKVCPACSGSRLGAIARSVRIAGRTISDLCDESSATVLDEINSLHLSPSQEALARPIKEELVAKLNLLERIGLSYLPLNRSCATLSGGELQRLRLSAAMGSPLSGTLYILDEPTAGLHPNDSRRILGEISSLVTRGNSVLVIEHDLDMLLAADHLIEVGPGGGKQGGHIIFNGSNDLFSKAHDTPTSRAMFTQLPPPRDTKNPSLTHLIIKHASHHNLSLKDICIPLQKLVTVAGVAGAGKSSLLHGVLYETLLNSERSQVEWQTPLASISSTEPIGRVLLVDQKPIGANARSTPASYLKILDELRKLYAMTSLARERGYKESFFSYNSGKGRCPECKGLGELRLEMNFLATARVRCDTCQGKRYTLEAQSILYQGRSIDETLNLTFSEARSHFAHHRIIGNLTARACDLGLGYLTLGQDASTLSGGESQRLKLVVELSKRRTQHTLYLFDEPTTGLHRSDVEKLLETLRELVGQGHSVIVIEHEAFVVSQSDYVVELGPGPAEYGGKYLFGGAPKELLSTDTPWGNEMRRIYSDLPREGVQRMCAGV